MKCTSKEIDKIISLLEDYISDDDSWNEDHISIRFDDVTATATIEIWDMDENDYRDLTESIKL